MMKRNHHAVLAALGLFAIGTPVASAGTTTGEVVAVASGDTVTYRLKDRLARQREIEIRLYGVDAPDPGQPRGEQARRFVAARLLNKTVTVKQVGKGTDDTGAVIAWVYLGKGCVNEWLLRNGLAWWYDRHQPADKRLQALETEAKEAKQGLWADPKPVPPWTWRAKQRKIEAICLRRCSRRNAMRAVPAEVILNDCRRSCTTKPATSTARPKLKRARTRRARRTGRRLVKTRSRTRGKAKDEPVVIEVLRGDKIDQRKVRPTADSKR